MQLLELTNLTRCFGGLTAVDRVCLDLAMGETVSIIGPNGAGKTTLFNLISGIDAPDSGQARLGGRNLIDLAPERIAALGLARTFQHGRVFGNLSVRDNVLVGAHTRLQAARAGLPLLGPLAEMTLALLRPARVLAEERTLHGEVEHILARFGERLLPRIDQPAHSLSYANRRRLEIARALALRPQLLLLDEPTAGMNPTETAEMLEVIRALKDEGMSILLIEHKLDLVMALSDRVVVLDSGAVIAEGRPAAVRDDPRVIEAYLGRPAVEHEGESPMPTQRSQSAYKATSPSAASGAIATDAMRSAHLSQPAAPTQGLDSQRARGRSNAAVTPAVLLELRGVETFYGPVQVHFGLDLEVRQGQIVCLLGGNASGKSTTMKVILGLVRPRAGQIIFDGTAITNWPTPQVIRRGIGSVPEARRIFPAMSVRENLLMGAYARDDRAAVVADLDRVLELFPRLRERLIQRGGTLSGGEQQMLAMARALMGRPRLIVMDEPTMGLAPLYVTKVLELIQMINRQGVTIFMVEQNANLALQIADYGYVLQTGRIALHGPATALRHNPHIQDAYLGGTTLEVRSGKRR